MKRSKFLANMSCFGAFSMVTPQDFIFSAVAPASTKSSPIPNSIRLIRNATLLIHYAGKKILVDPLLAAKGAYAPFAGGERNPTVKLPVPVEEILKNVDLVLVSHTHSDHFDAVARETLPKDIKLVHQPADAPYFEKTEFTNTHALHDHLLWEDINIYRTGGKHGTGEIGEKMGSVSGFVLKAKNQPTLYIIGDSIWTGEVAQAIEQHQPDFIVANTGGAKFPAYPEDPILMDEDQTLALLNASGQAKVIAVHMEALDHCFTNRTSLREKAQKHKVAEDQLLIPKDGGQVML